tara:strand:- start:874 stop:1047 length:174 start_codon:yes stop_codon:yes gene_type:complete
MNIDGIDTIQLCCLMRQRLERAAKTEYLEIPLDILARIEDDVLPALEFIQTTYEENE